MGVTAVREGAVGAFGSICFAPLPGRTLFSASRTNNGRQRWHVG
jgi:hypothetical protein